MDKKNLIMFGAGGIVLLVITVGILGYATFDYFQNVTEINLQNAQSGDSFVYDAAVSGDIVDTAELITYSNSNTSDSTDSGINSVGDLTPTANSSALTTSEITGLLQMREEEKLARDIYNALYEKWNLSVFANITKSESTHTLAVETLLSTYGISDPVTDDTYASSGVYINSNLTTIYASLLAKGNLSIEDAIDVGLTIEDLDINDLENLLNNTSNSDILNVYENLLKGSRNHLRAFNNQAVKYGINYTPKYISISEFNDIVSGSIESGYVTSGQSGVGNSSNGARGYRGGN